VTFGERDSWLLQTREATELSSLQTYWRRVNLVVTYTENKKFRELLQTGGKKYAANTLAVCRLCCDPWTDTKRGAAVNKGGWGIEHWSYTGSVVVVDLCNFKKQGVLVLYPEDTG